MIRSLFGLLLLAPLAVGCNTSGRFTVGIVNRTDEPLSVGMVKNGPPPEAAWASPTQIGIGAPQLSDRKWGTLIPPGGQAVVGPVAGKFASGVTAFVRIYAGDRTVTDLLAVSPGSPDRVDVPLDNGRTDLVVQRQSGRLVATPSERVNDAPLTR